MGKKEDDRPENWREVAIEYAIYRNDESNYRKADYKARNQNLSPIDYFCDILVDKYGLQCFKQRDKESRDSFRNRCRHKLNGFIDSYEKERTASKPFQQHCKPFYFDIYEDVKEILLDMRRQNKKVDCLIMRNVFIACAEAKNMDTRPLYVGFVTKARKFCTTMGLVPVIEFASTAGTGITNCDMFPYVEGHDHGMLDSAPGKSNVKKRKYDDMCDEVIYIHSVICTS